MKRIMSFLCAAAILAAAVLCGCGSQNSSSQSSGQSSQAAEQTTAQPVTDSPVKTTGGKVHISDSTLGDIWISELEGVAHNKLSADGFTSDANFKYYSENGSEYLKTGGLTMLRLPYGIEQNAVPQLLRRPLTPKRRRKRNTPTIFSATSSSTIPLPMTGRSSRTTAPAPTA